MSIISGVGASGTAWGWRHLHFAAESTSLPSSALRIIRGIGHVRQAFIVFLEASFSSMYVNLGPGFAAAEPGREMAR